MGVNSSKSKAKKNKKSKESGGKGKPRATARRKGGKAVAARAVMRGRSKR